MPLFVYVRLVSGFGEAISFFTLPDFSEFRLAFEKNDSDTFNARI